MNARHSPPILTALALAALTLALSACGNKGPLVLPTQPAPPEAPVAKPGEVPVTISNANAPPVAAPPTSKKALPVPPLDGVLPPASKKPQDGKDGDKPQDSKDGDAKPAEPTPAGQGDG